MEQRGSAFFIRNKERIKGCDVQQSYFSHEGYLSGISMNKNKSTLKTDYKKVLRFYGYDVDVEAPRPVSTTRRPMVQVPVVTSTSKNSSKKPGAFKDVAIEQWFPIIEMISCKKVQFRSILSYFLFRYSAINSPARCNGCYKRRHLTTDITKFC